MALSGGNWLTYAEMIKLTQPYQIPGIAEEDIKRNNPVDFMPLAQANHTGEKIVWLREVDAGDADVSDVGRGGQTVLTEDVEYTEKEALLRTAYDYRKLDKFNPSIHGTFNNYEEIMVEAMYKRVKMRLGHKVVYDNYDYDGNSLQMFGWHYWGNENTGNLDIDAGETALSVANWRSMYYAMKHGVDAWFIPFELQKHIDAAHQEKGWAGLKADTAGSMANFTYTKEEWGATISRFMGIPIIPCDYLVAEQVNTGAGSDARAVYTSGTKQYSLFGIKFGNASLAESNPGLRLAFGLTENDGDFFNMEYFEKLENYIGKAVRLSSNTALVPGSSMCIARMRDFTDAAVTV